MLEATTLRVQTVTLCTESRQVSEFCVAGASVGKRCPLMHSTTKGRGAASEEDCVCRAGYFKGGGSCEPCEAAGTVCTEEGVAVATLPLLPDWWRLPNSTQLQRCFPVSNCTGGTNASALCGEGYESDLLYPSCNPMCPSCNHTHPGCHPMHLGTRAHSAASVPRRPTARATTAPWGGASLLNAAS